jgi:hypothetical protein
MTFIGMIAGLLVWQLSRMITAFQRSSQNKVVERHFIRETHPSQLAAPADTDRKIAEPSSVVEHTTRQMASVYREPDAG